MNKSVLETMPRELQEVALDASDIARAVALVKPTNLKVREAADARLQFEDEPAAYVGFLREEAGRR